MARPKLGIAVRRYDINLTLREGTDDDLIALLERVPARQRVGFVKKALRSHAISPEGVFQHRNSESEQSEDSSAQV